MPDTTPDKRTAQIDRVIDSIDWLTVGKGTDPIAYEQGLVITYPVRSTWKV